MITVAAELVDPRSQRDGARRRIPWDLLDTSSLDAESRSVIGQTWHWRMKQEHLAVGAFALLTSELAATGCEPTVLSLIARAAADEVRHAEICRAVAVCFLGQSAVPRRLRGVPRVPAHPSASPAERALLHVVEMCCLGETLTGVYLTEMLARTTSGAMRAVIESLLEDEIDHGRVGWAHLASRREPELWTALALALPDMVERTMGWVIRRAVVTPEAANPAREAFGYLGNDTAAAVVTRTLDAVILPGFDLLGVDLGPTRERIAARAWPRAAA